MTNSPAKSLELKYEQINVKYVLQNSHRHKYMIEFE